MHKKYIVGVDVGGTFTDLYIHNQEDGTHLVHKTPSTLENQSEGILNGIGEALGSLQEVEMIIHGTTTATNALLERKGAKVGLITTKGFADVLEMRRRDRPNTWGLTGTFEPVIPRHLRLEVSERTDAEGQILESLDPDETRQAVEKLKEAGCESLCICFLHSYQNNSNELAALEIAEQIWPNEWINLSSRVLPEIREFERVSTTVLNAYLQPIMATYFKSIQDKVYQENPETKVYVVQSNGGSMSLATASMYPVRTALSGPAAGVIAAAGIGKPNQFENLITCDVGGTSFDVALISQGKASETDHTTLDFGMTIRTPMLEISTIGAGGGSIAKINAGGLLTVGPESAGSFPGPACYGNDQPFPTVTDANLVLGRINPNKPIGNMKKFDMDAAKNAIDTHIAKPLSLSTQQAAEAILKVANAKMAGAIRLVSIEKGHDPRNFAAMPFGGGGSLHICSLIKEAGVSAAIVPPHPGVTSAFGCTISNMRHDFVRSFEKNLEDLDEEAFLWAMQDHLEEGLARLEESRLEFVDKTVEYYAEMSYEGQTHGVSVPFLIEEMANPEAGIVAKELAKSFDAFYLEQRGAILEGGIRKVKKLHSVIVGEVEKRESNRNFEESESFESQERNVWFDGQDYKTPIINRNQLKPGETIPGPLIIEQKDTTIVIEPKMSVSTQNSGVLIIKEIKDI